jgi:hypothetical protein
MLHAQRQPGSRELFELNPETHTLAITRLPECTATTYQLRYWPRSQTPTLLAVNSLGSLVAVGSCTGTLLVLRVPVQKDGVFEEIEFSEGRALRGLKALAWHPLSATDSHLATLTRNGRLSLFDCAAAARMADEDALCRLPPGPEQTVLLSAAAVSETAFVSDGWSAFCFGAEAAPADAPWQWLTTYVVRESGDVWAVCPFLPGVFRVRRTATFAPLRRHIDCALATLGDDCTDRLAALKHQQTFVAMLEQRAETVAHVSGSTDWLVVDWSVRLGVFGHLAPKPQGPLLVEPEPLDVSSGPGQALDEARRVWCFAAVTAASLALAVAYRSGRVDLLAACADIEPHWQLDATASVRGSDRRRPVSDPASVFALLESIHVRGGAEVADLVSRDEEDMALVLRSRKAVVCVSLAVHEDTASEAFKHEGTASEAIKHEDTPGPDNALSPPAIDIAWECRAWLLAEAGAAEELCAVQVASGAHEERVVRVFASADNGRLLLKTETPLCSARAASIATPPTAGPNRVLQAMESLGTAAALDALCPGALQLESLHDELAETLARLARTRRDAVKGLAVSAALPAGIDEPSAVALNDLVAAWEADLVAPALRFGHELCLRIGVLRAALQQQRQVLLRARELLAEKPARLRRLFDASAQLVHRQRLLSSRVSELRSRLAEPAAGSGRDFGGIADELQMAHGRLGTVMRSVQNRQVCASPDSAAFLKMQLELQSTLLSRLRRQLS